MMLNDTQPLIAAIIDTNARCLQMKLVRNGLKLIHNCIQVVGALMKLSAPFKRREMTALTRTLHPDRLKAMIASSGTPNSPPGDRTVLMENSG